MDITSLLVRAFCDELVESEEDTLGVIHNLSDYQEPELLQMLEDLIRDTSLSWSKKADDYVFMDGKTEEEGIELFKYIWRILTVAASRNDPWPLDT